MTGLRVVARATAHAAAAEAAARVAARLVEAIAARGHATVAFSGGTTPELMLSALARQPLAWHALDIFQVDERLVPREHADRNARLLGVLGRPDTAARLHPMPVEDADLDGACRQYEAELQICAGLPAVLDVVHLGLGDDGHTASLVPGDGALAIDDRDVAITGPYRGHRRMTLTYPTLNRARHVLWLVTGASKADMLLRLVRGDRSIPAGIVSAASAVVVADAAAWPFESTA